MGEHELICQSCGEFIGWLTDSTVLDGYVYCAECYKGLQK